MLGGIIDMESVERAGCCRECEHQFYEPNREEWVKGWRPDRERIASVRDSRNFVQR